MHSFVLITALLCGEAGLPDGTLIFLENCNKVVERYTDETIDHAAIVFNDDGQTWVYEATPPKVRRVSLDEYYDEIARLNEQRKVDERIYVLRPREPYAAEQIAAMKSFADAQLGRRYSVRNYVRNKPGDGTHCAELAANTLNHSRRIYISQPHAVNPAELMRDVQHLHTAPIEITVEAQPREDTWCQRLWNEWLDCHTWCSWSCYETWTFCR